MDSSVRVATFSQVSTLNGNALSLPFVYIGLGATNANIPDLYVGRVSDAQYRKRPYVDQRPVRVSDLYVEHFIGKQIIPNS